MVVQMGEEDIKATTFVSQDGRRARIRVKTDGTLPQAEQVGLYAHSIAHEIFLHAQSQMEAKSQNVAAESEFKDHQRTYVPRTASNRYLEAMHRVFDRLTGTNTKQCFAFAVQEDIRAQANADEELREAEFEAIDLWASSRRISMQHAIYERARHNW
jgi:hypothetical protein